MSDISLRRRPRDSYFLQQTFRTHYPLMTVGSWIPIFRLLAIVYMILGLICFYQNMTVTEYKFEYTDCLSESAIESKKNNTNILYCKDEIDKNPGHICHCQISVYMSSIPKNVYVYYGLEFYYQNYLPYVDSVDNFQLCGLRLTRGECSSNDNETLPTVPCGMIANSMFNDTFVLEKRILARDESGHTKRYLFPISIIRKNISWKFPERYRNPTVPKNQTLKYVFRNTKKPANWHKPIYELDLEDPTNNGFENEPFINWMQISPFSSLRKAYGYIDHSDNSFTSTGLQDGYYLLQINYSYPVHRFNGKKYIIISNTSSFGGKNYFLSYIFLITSILNSIIAILFYYLDKKYGKVSTQVYDYLYFNYQQDDRLSGKRYSRQ
ncbi:cell cycle control protein 50A-like isoform X1 [Dermatophagoides pteronyssinus]|uniref:cell cycle control protein 50A-like isoform X1 n=2 Tax=Dermatophagoides pteronyssinus TaxID=6956 RepID=UPI003F664032